MGEGEEGLDGFSGVLKRAVNEVSEAFSTRVEKLKPHLRSDELLQLLGSSNGDISIEKRSRELEEGEGNLSRLCEGGGRAESKEVMFEVREGGREEVRERRSC